MSYWVPCCIVALIGGFPSFHATAAEWELNLDLEKWISGGTLKSGEWAGKDFKTDKVVSGYATRGLGAGLNLKPWLQFTLESREQLSFSSNQPTLVLADQKKLSLSGASPTQVPLTLSEKYASFHAVGLKIQPSLAGGFQLELRPKWVYLVKSFHTDLDATLAIQPNVAQLNGTLDRWSSSNLNFPGMSDLGSPGQGFSSDLRIGWQGERFGMFYEGVNVLQQIKFNDTNYSRRLYALRSVNQQIEIQNTPSLIGQYGSDRATMDLPRWSKTYATIQSGLFRGYAGFQQVEARSSGFAGVGVMHGNSEIRLIGQASGNLDLSWHWGLGHAAPWSVALGATWANDHRWDATRLQVIRTF